MTWTAESLLAYWQIVRAPWSVIPDALVAIVTKDDLPGVAVEGGLRADGLAQISALASETSADRHDIWHEGGHILQQRLRQLRGLDTSFVDPNCPVGTAFWAVRGFPGTYGAHFATGQWATVSYEALAECFAAVNLGDVERTQTYGVALDRGRMLAFFTSLLPAQVPPAPAPVPAPPPPFTIPRYCADSTRASDLPAGMAFVAGYVDGQYKWSDADWALFPNSIKVRIATNATTNDGHVLDVELGAATVYQAPAWVQMRRAAGVDPTVYCSLGLWDAVKAAFKAQSVPEPHYWIALYDNQPIPIYGAVAKQFANSVFTGRHYDTSVVPGRWPGVEEDMTPDEVIALIESKYNLTNTIDALKKQQTKEVIALREAADKLKSGLV